MFGQSQGGRVRRNGLGQLAHLVLSGQSLEGEADRSGECELGRLEPIDCGRLGELESNKPGPREGELPATKSGRHFLFQGIFCPRLAGSEGEGAFHGGLKRRAIRREG